MENLTGEVQDLLPQVRDVLGDSPFGRDALAKAEAVLSRVQERIAPNDVRVVKENIESLERTRNMFKGVVTKTSLR